MRRILERTSEVTNRAAEYVMIVLMIGISLLIFTQVVMRYVFNYSLFWSEELARYILIWITFIGASVGFKRTAHMGIDFVYMRLSRSSRRVVSIVIYLVILLFAFVMSVYGFNLSIFVWWQFSPALFIRMTFPYISISIGGVLIVIHTLANMAGDLARESGEGA